MDRNESQLPLSTLLDQQQRQRNSLWWTFRPSTSRTESRNQQPQASSSSMQPTNQREDDKENQCCSLVNSVWRNSPMQTADLFQSTRQQENYGAAVHLFGTTEPTSSRNHPSQATGRAIVTLNAEHIGPEDQRHHPLDVDKNKVFTRKPWGLTINSRTEQIYIPDREHNVILVFGPDGEYQRKFGGPGREPGFFKRPTGVAYDAIHDRIFVTDKDNHRVQAFCANTGQFLFTFGSQGNRPGQFSYPWGIAVSPDGKQVAVADARNHRLQLFTAEGVHLRQFTFNSSQRQQHRTITSYPRGVAFDKTGLLLYVTDFNLHRILQVDINFQRVETIVDDRCLKRPSGIDVDHSGNILVCDTRHNLVRKFCPNGKPVEYLERIGNTHFQLPLDISVMPAGQIAVLDLNGRVRVF